MCCLAEMSFYTPEFFPRVSGRRMKDSKPLWFLKIGNAQNICTYTTGENDKNDGFNRRRLTAGIRRSDVVV